MTSLIQKTATELKKLLETREVSSVELTKAFIEHTKNKDQHIKAYLKTDETYTIAQAEASDKRRAQGKLLGPLDGIPVSIKDVIAEKGQQLTCASKMLANFISPYDATVIEKLKLSGTVLWGRLNMDEFAMGSSTENSSMQITRNPWNTDYSPGGSSGGSSACVAACMTPLSLGSDTGGSIRQPASLCGIVGIKPTYGLVSRYGLVAFASSLDQIGPFARTVEDASMLLQAIVGHDKKDSTSYPASIANYTQDLHQKKTWTLGIPQEYFGEGLDPEVKKAVEKAIEFYQSQDCKIQTISLPNMQYAMAVYYIIAPAEASSNLARYDGIRYTHRSQKATDGIDLYCQSRGEGFGKEVKRRILLGTYVLSSGYYDAYYLKAQKVRTLIRQDFSKAFETVDAILTPTAPTPGLKIGEKATNPLQMYLSDIYTVSVNLAGLPGISIPCGMSHDGLPIGLQIIGKPYQEASMLSIAHLFEANHSYANLHPTLENLK